MSKEQKANRYVQDKMFPYIVNSVSMSEKPCFTQKDLREAYLRGWGEALKSQWINVEDKLPPKYEDVLVIYEYCESIQINTDSYIGEDIWCYGNSKIIAWMPIPSFDEILQANKDVLKR